MKKRLLATIPVLLVVFLCSCPVFATSASAADRYGKAFYPIDNKTDVYVYLNLTAFRPYQYGSGGSNLVAARFETLGELLIFNDNDLDFKFTGNEQNHMRMTIGVNSNANGNTPWSIVDFEYIGGQLNASSMNLSNMITFESYQPYSDGDVTAIVIPAHSYVVCYFKITYQANMATLTGIITPDFTDASVYLTSGYTYSGVHGTYNKNYQSYIPDIYDELVSIYQKNDQQLSVLQQILASYNQNVPQSQMVTNESSALETQSDNVHNQETSYYTQTNTALSNTGLSNFSFSPNVIGGLGKVKDHFTYVWNKLGDYKDVYLFSMTLAIALMIIRHVRPIRRKKEE